MVNIEATESPFLNELARELGIENPHPLTDEGVHATARDLIEAHKADKPEPGSEHKKSTPRKYFPTDTGELSEVFMYEQSFAAAKGPDEEQIPGHLVLHVGFGNFAEEKFIPVATQRYLFTPTGIFVYPTTPGRIPQRADRDITTRSATPKDRITINGILTNYAKVLEPNRSAQPPVASA